MKVKLFAITLCAYASIAQAAPLKPEKCPGVAAIRAAGLSSEYLEKTGQRSWAVFNRNQPYDTNGNWDLAVTDVVADNQTDAYTEASASLNSLIFVKGPYELPFSNMWACSYMTNEGYTVYAFDSLVSLKLIKPVW